MNDSMNAYQADLAFIHDVGYGGYANACAPGILELLRGSGIAGGRVVDLGCGSGIWARRLTDAGYDATGVDISPAMIELARRKAPQGEFHVGSLLDFRPPRCRAVTALGEVVNYLFDPGNKPQALPKLFRRLHHCLEGGGLLVFDVAEPERCRDLRQSHRLDKDWACLVDYEHDRQNGILTRHIVTFRRRGKGFRRQEETHRLRLLRAADLARTLRSTGFTVRVRRRLGDFRLPPGVACLVARKNKSPASHSGGKTRKQQSNPRSGGRCYPRVPPAENRSR